MCGIVAYFGKRESTLDVLIGGLRRLEYRGYDSAGIAVTTDQSSIINCKAVGRVLELEKLLTENIRTQTSGIGIAHTRWATHGSPSEINSHPHHSKDKNIWLVHNGIIENYLEIKEFLIEKNISFYSDTDTEVLANLIGYYYDGDLRLAIQTALNQVRGAFAIAVICSKEPERLICAKLGAPMVVGICSNNEYVIASDVSAVISKTRDVIYLEDGEMIEISNNCFRVSSFDGVVISKSSQYIDWSDEQASKDGYDHFLLKEIFEQPKAVVDTTRGRLLPKEADIQFGGLLDVKNRLAEIERINLIGVGTSFYACRLGEMYFETLSLTPSRSEMSPEYRYKNTLADKHTWSICISQSGETADTIGCIQELQKKSGLVTGIVNTVGSTISRITDSGVYQHIGPELSVASTKAFTSASVLLLMHAIYFGRQRNLDFIEASLLIQDINHLPHYIADVLKESENILRIAQRFYHAKNFIYIGRHYNYPIAQEGALKLKEISYIHAEGMSSGELKHGPIALIDENTPTVAICTQDAFYEKQVSSIQEVIARKGPIIGIVNTGDTVLSKYTKHCIFVPKTLTPEVQPIVSNIAQQLLAYHIANLLGVDIDKPRNLAKSVTVE
jgi:glutamine---fructose-6-phosphate transaminase (isomerizing)